MRVICVTLLAVLLAAAQTGEQVITVDVDLVNVYFSVCNKKGRLIPDLSRESFSVYEDGTAQAITNFSRETDLPLTIAVLIDTSGSVRGELGFERDAAIEFLRSTLRRGRDKAAIFTFDSSVDLRQDYTDDFQALASAIGKIRAGGGTRLYDALNVLMKGRLASEQGRRGIILLSDGDDNSSRSSPQDVVEAAQRTNVAIYPISVSEIGFRSEDSDRSDAILNMLASETGGKASFPKRLRDLPKYFQHVSEELRSQYAIAYRSTNPKRDGTYRRIRIEVRDGHLSAHTRPGYYAPLAIARKE